MKNPDFQICALLETRMNKIIDEIKTSISPEMDADNSDNLSMVMDYSKLINNFSSKLGRVMSRYS